MCKKQSSIGENDHFYVIEATRDDIAIIDEMCDHEDFHWGLHNWLIYFDASPHGFYLLIDKLTGKAVGFFNENHFSPNFTYGHMGVVLAEARRKGGFQLLSTVSENRRSNQYHMTFGQNRNWLILPATDPGVKFGYKQIGFEGEAIKNRLKSTENFCADKNFFVRKATSDDLAAILAYDRKLYGKLASESRAKFIEEWTQSSQDPKLSITCVAYKKPTDNKHETEVLCGYGVARFLKHKDWRLTPVYGEDKEVGYALLLALTNALSADVVLFFAFPANNRTSLQFCRDAGMEQIYSEVRFYKGPFPDLPAEKIYAENEFWPL